jgi:hypothetical protein
VLQLALSTTLVPAGNGLFAVDAGDADTVHCGLTALQLAPSPVGEPPDPDALPPPLPSSPPPHATVIRAALAHKSKVASRFVRFIVVSPCFEHDLSR